VKELKIVFRKKIKFKTISTKFVMNEKKVLRVGILGFGTVGQGTWKHLVENEKAWERILGVQLIPTRASVRSLSKKELSQ
jgi:hypothetical protein